MSLASLTFHRSYIFPFKKCNDIFTVLTVINPISSNFGFPLSLNEDESSISYLVDLCFRCLHFPTWARSLICIGAVWTKSELIWRNSKYFRALTAGSPRPEREAGPTSSVDRERRAREVRVAEHGKSSYLALCVSLFLMQGYSAQQRGGECPKTHSLPSAAGLCSATNWSSIFYSR